MIRFLIKRKVATAWFLFFVFCCDFALMAAESNRRIFNSSNRQLTSGGSGLNMINKPVHTFNPAEIISVKLPNEAAVNNSIGHLQNFTQPTKANIGGPGQPEMSAFQSVNANNMVDLFSGDFSYNIPVMDVGGYPIGLSYRSGITMDQEASWVGLGWSINPGAINRNVRGLPDDFNGTEKIVKELNIRKNWTAGVTGNFVPEILGKDLSKSGKFGKDSSKKLTASLGFFYNNYMGVGLEVGIGASINPGKHVNTILARDAKGVETKMDTSYFTGKLGGSLSLNLNSQQGVTTDASLIMKMGKESAKNNGTIVSGVSLNSRTGLQALQLSMENHNNEKVRSNKKFSANGRMEGNVDLSFARPSYVPTITNPITNLGFSLTLKGGGAVFGFHPLGAIKGYYSQQYIRPKDKIRHLPAYGYMHSAKANDDDYALLDFNREKDIPFRKSSPHTAIPVYTYDTYSISGEGIGGSFRPYRGDVGYVRDHQMVTHNGGASLGLDFGAAPNLGHFGGNIQLNYAQAKAERWKRRNLLEELVRFRENDSTYEAIYFRNPSEQTTNDESYINSIGGDEVVRPELTGFPNFGAYSLTPSSTRNLITYNNQHKTGSFNVSSPILKNKRDKRTQVISYLSAQEAQIAGLDTFIKSYPLNVFPKGKCDSSFTKISRIDGIDGNRKPNHISEITVLNKDSRRYIYGLPVYNLGQHDVTFAADKNRGNNSTGLVDYTPGLDNSSGNPNGKDNYFSKESTPPYAHSYLLTSILSADYSDITGDGVTEDDNGDAVKFNYSKLNSSTGENYKWRGPFEQNKANYSEGLRADATDDKAHYSYGEKELWYLNSIESKTMIATFVLDTENRKDGFGVVDENGGINTNVPLKRLKQINLYSKADYYKNPAKAKPIKTVRFYYSYNLCVGAAGSLSGYGKLTLDSLSFSYNGNNRAVKNKYRFNYNALNPSYNSKSYDRWGSYKPETDNPTGVSNTDYAYAVQNKIKADNNAGAWALSAINLPSGAKINVTYEADDYGYVQNRRAMGMMKIAGMGNSAAASPVNYLYDNSNKLNTKDYQYIFIDVPTPVINSKTDIYNKYLEGTEKIYFKMQVKMPTKTEYETITFYAEYEDYGYVSANRIWLKLKEFGNNRCAPAIAAVQFLRLNLPGLAFPGSDLYDASFKETVLGLMGTAKQFKQQIIGFPAVKRQEGACKQFDNSKSFIRLNIPDYTKFGGGHRVKRITISDNWNAMTGQKESLYGQDYDYSTTKEIFYDSSNIKKSKIIKISSGVASYEPMVGNEENPFRTPIEFKEKVSLGPTDFLYSEYPYGESFFPSASVGYSKVRVSSINKKNTKSFSGWEESEFYTSKDFPTVTDYTVFDNESRKVAALKIPLGLGVSKRATTLAQGFKVELNNMNGMLKSQKSYAANDSVRPISYTTNYYRTVINSNGTIQLNNNLAVMDSANGKINPNGLVGKDVELMMDMREHSTWSSAVDVNVNVDVFMAFIFPITIPAFFPKFSLDNNTYRSAVAVKVINRYGILDSVVHYEKGSLVSTKNLVYSSETGEPVLTRTQNEFNDPIYNFSYPAYWKYSGLSPAYKNIGAVFNGINVLGGKITNSDLSAHLESGDELLIQQSSPFPVSDTCGQTDWKLTKNARRIWVVDINKAAGTPGKDLYLIDANGNPYNISNAAIKIIRSGKRNNLDAGIASFTSINNPVQVVSNSLWQLKADSTIGVIATGANTYKDYWTVDNKFNSFVKCTGVNGPGCDSITKIINGFRKYVVNGSISATYDANGCQNNMWGTTTTPLIDNGTLKFKDLFKNSGTVGWPLEVADTVTSTYSKLEFNLADTICNLNGFEYEAKISNQHITAPLSGGTYMFLFFKLRKAGVLFPEYFKIAPGSSTSTPTLELAGYPVRTFPAVNGLNLFGAHTYKLQFATDSVRLYIDNIYRGAVQNYGGTTTSMGISHQFRNYKMQIDWVKIRNISPAQNILNEQFNSGCSSFDSPAFNFRCGTDCQTSFKNYFNAKTGKNYSFAQIDSLIKDNCRYSYSPCYDTIAPIKDTCIIDCKSIFAKRFNPYTQGLWGNWRVDKAYTFYDERTENSVAAATNIRKDGTFKKFVPFWNFGTDTLSNSNYSRWVWNQEITRVNKKGMETENRDPLGRYNSGLYGYNQTLPVAVAQNARYRQMVFDGFEDYEFITDSCGRRCPPPRHLDWSTHAALFNSTEAHSGKYSLKVASQQSAALSFAIGAASADTISQLLTRVTTASCTRLDSIYSNNDNITTPVFSPFTGDTLVVGLWVKEAKDCQCDSFVNNRVIITSYNSSNTVVGTTPLRPSGNIIDGWQRYESIVIIPATAASATISLQNVSSGGSATDAYFDDFRIHPFNSNIKSFVYNNVNLRLMAELDENNYASFYEYDDEGTLIRVKKETQMGIKTIQETRSVLSKQQQP